MERFFSGLCRVEEHVARATDRLFGALISRSMGRANFVAVTAALLICTRVIGAAFVEVSSLSELSALAFAVAIAKARTFSARACSRARYGVQLLGLPLRSFAISRPISHVKSPSAWSLCA